MLVMAGLGGHLSIFPTLYPSLYGLKSGGKAYSYVFSSFGVSAIVGVLFYQFIAIKHGF
jgi:hypothetical protein